MILELKGLKGLDFAKLMAIYREGNEENASYFYPNLLDKTEAIRRVEGDFLDYLRRDFFSRAGARYLVLEEDGIWVSALRLTPLEERRWYLEALETRPDCRRKGCGARLLAGTLERLKEEGPFQLFDCVSKKNFPSLRMHEKSGFFVTAEPAWDYLRGVAEPGCLGLEYRWPPEG